MAAPSFARSALLFLFVLMPVAAAADGGTSDDSALFGDLPPVAAATLHSQSLAEAPASVTVITADDIRIYGYRTLADLLNAARGFTVTSDHIYSYAGVRGFAIPGDFNCLFLVMINGHPMTDVIFDSNNFFGEDFGLDLDIVDRIEIIRGPTSALYGSNGVLANVNIITKSTVDGPKYMAGTDTDSLGMRKLTVAASGSLGKGVNVLVDAAGYLDDGHDLSVPGYGVANHTDGQNGYHSFVDVTWGGWDFSAYFNTRQAKAPILGDGGTFNSAGQFYRDTRDFVGATYTHELGSAELRWQFYYDHYQYGDRYDEPAGDGIVDNRDYDAADWISSQLIYSRPDKLGELTAGLSTTLEIRNFQGNRDFWPDQTVYLHVNHPDESFAPFLQQEWAFATGWKAYFGVRLDDSRDFGAYASPRIALVYQPSAKTSYKLVYGHPFRNPSNYELYYSDGYNQIANPGLKRETAEALEFSVERHIAKSLDAVVNPYAYWLHSVIEGVWVNDTIYQYQNAGDLRSTGVEFELRGRPAAWLQTTASLSLQRATDVHAGATLPNAPSRLAKFQAAVPVFGDRAHFSSAVQYMSSRLTAAGASVRPVALVDSTVSTTKLFHGFDFVAGIRNALNWGYNDPVDVIDQIPANGRSLFVKLIWRQDE